MAVPSFPNHYTAKWKIKNAAKEAFLLLLIHCHKELISECQLIDPSSITLKSLYQPLSHPPH
jgi:hypothetical protein